ncbi:MAG: polysaccharide biosynthesis/export protein [Chthoniobacter sp.]|nr:polysaccharide biosynthesis/export protein [Chthoniobacter sp.]
MAQGPAPRAEAVRTGPPAGYYPGDRMEVVDPDKKLAAGDEVTFQIEQDREGGFPRVVTATGEIDVPPYGRVKVAGKTTGEAATEIKRLLEKDYYYTATVRLSLDRVSRQLVKAGQILLSGEIRAVGPLDLSAGDRLTVSQALLKAGGVRDFGDDRKVQVTRIENGVTKRYEIDVKKILQTGVLDKDMVLMDGDRIHVPRVWGKL